MDLVNHQCCLAARPVGLPKPSDWRYTEEPVPEPGAGEALVKTLLISLDPAMRGWMNDARSYIPPVGVGEVMRALAAGEVRRLQRSRARPRRPRHRPARGAAATRSRPPPRCRRSTRRWRRCPCI